MTPPYETVEIDDGLHEFVALEREPGEELPLESEETALPLPICALNAPAPTPVEWVVRDLFTAGDVGLIVGDGGSFKSSASLHIAAAVAGGYKAFDRFETTHGPALVCSAEDPGSVIQMRLEAFVRGHAWDRKRVLSNIHYFALAGIRLKDARWRRHLTDVVGHLAPTLIIMDPFVDLSGLDEENSNSEASGVMGFARELARSSRAAAVFVHHGNKTTEGRSQSRIRGATTIANASRGTLFFEFTDAGVMVEQLKMTYAEKIPAFTLTRDIASEPTNRGAWISARLATVKPADARATRAEELVLTQILLSPGILNSRGVREAAKGSGVWPADVDKALKTLHAAGHIEFEKGPRNEKTWSATKTGKTLLDRVEQSQHSQKNDRVDRVGPSPTRSNGNGGDRVSLTETHTRIAPRTVLSDEPAWEPGEDPRWDDDDDDEGGGWEPSP